MLLRFRKCLTGEWNRPSFYLLFLVTAATYFLLAKFGLKLATLNNSVSPVWPATGFAIGIVYLRGCRLLPAIFLGALAANWQGTPLFATLGISFGNTLEALVGGWLVRYITEKRQDQFQELTEGIALLAASMIAPIVSATIGVGSLAIFANLNGPLIPSVWWTWVVGDSLGAFVLIPLFFAVASIFKLKSENYLIMLARALLFTIVGTFISWLFFKSSITHPFIFLMFPLILAAVRWGGALSATLLTLALCSLSLGMTIVGIGPFTMPNLNQSLINAQLFVLTLSLTAVFLQAFSRAVPLKTIAPLLLAGWFLGGIIFNSFYQHEKDRDQDIFKDMVAKVEAALLSQELTLEEELRGASGLFAASKSVEPDEWRNYVMTLKLGEKNNLFRGMGVVFPVDKNDLPNFAKRQASLGLKGFSVHSLKESMLESPRPMTNQSFVITFIEPLEENLQALGLDLASEEYRREAAVRARESGKAALTRSITLVQAKDEGIGLLLFFPVYKKNVPLDTLEERLANHLGWVYMPLLSKSLFENALQTENSPLELYAFNGDVGDTKDLIFRSNPIGEIPKHFDYVSEINLGQNKWKLAWNKSELFPTSASGTSAWIGFISSLITLLLSGVVFSLQRANVLATQLAAQKSSELARAQKNFETVSQGLNEGIWETDIATGSYNLSPVARELLGVSEEVQYTSDFLDSQIEIEDRPRVLQERISYLTGKTNQYLVEFRIRRFNDSQLRWMQIKGFATRNERGIAESLSGTIADVTEKRQFEFESQQNLKKLDELMKIAPVGIYQTDTEGKCTFVNSKLCEMTGLTPSQSEGHGWHRAVHPDDRIELERKWAEAIAQFRSFSHEFRYLHPNGRVVWLIGTAIPLKSQDNEVTGYLGISQDITSLKLIELDLRESKIKAESATKAKSEFLATMSHEIRTPINGIIGMASLLNDTQLDKQQKQFINALSRSAEGLLTIINDILDFSKIEAGKLEIEAIHFNLNELIEGVESSYGILARQKGLVFSIQNNVSPETNLIGDPGRIRQILGNLISNSIKFTEKGFVSVIVDYNQTLKIEVEDSGVGIPESAKVKMFKPFSQADSSTNRKFGGTGLGLSISKYLVDLMSGEIGIRKKSGPGALIGFSLPLKSGSKTLAVQNPLRIKSDRKANVLIAEDNAVNQMVAMAFVKKMGHSAVIAANGRIAVEMLEKNNFDLVLMDCQMPEIDGFEATSLIRKDGKVKNSKIPIIAMTANAMKGDREKCIEAGMDDYLPKPINESDLFQMIEKWVTHSKDNSNRPSPSLNTSAYTQLIEQMGAATPEFLKQLNGVFINDVNKSLKILDDAVASQNWEVIGRIGHSLKSSSAQIGADSLAELFKRLDQMAKSKPSAPNSDLGQLIATIKIEFKKVEDELALAANIQRAA